MWQSPTRPPTARPRPRPVRRSPTPCAGPCRRSAASSSCSSAPPPAATTTAAAPAAAAPTRQGHRGHLRRRRRRPTASGSRSTSARRSSSTSPPTRPGEIHVHSDPEQELEYEAGETTLDAARSTSPASSTSSRTPREGHRPARSQLRCRRRHLLAHGIGGPRTCRSRPSWRSRARSPRWSSPSRCWRWPGASRGTTPPPAAAPRRPGWPRWSTRAWRVALRALRHGALPVRRGRRGLRQGPGHQPGLRDVLRVVVGRPGAALAALRPGLEGDQPGPHDQPAVREGLRQRPGPGRLHLPRAARATGRPRSGCSRSCGSSWSTPTRPSWRRCGCGARRTSR